jgi:ferredoxin
MGHVVNPDREYRLLQKRLDRNVTGAPDSPTFMKILKLLFSPDDAQLARRIPSQPISLGALSRKVGVPVDELADKMTNMAERGLVVDMEIKGKRYIFLAPVVIGFFEFTFMRTREDLPMGELAKLFHEYMIENRDFSNAVFAGQTQLGRSLVNENALPEDDHTEILDYERASYLIKSATHVGVSLCCCRHKAGHLGEACTKPQEICMSLNYGASTLIRNGLARSITNAEGMKLLEQAREEGLAQTGDNVQKKVTYICNCCGCCCGMMRAIRDFDIRGAIVTSNWLMRVDLDKCTGCGKCAKACPVGAIDLEKETTPDGKKRKWAVVEEDVCLGCGVCYTACEFGAISMTARAQRVLTPETVFDQRVMMAIERGKLADLILDAPERLSHRALARVLGLIEKSPPFRAAMAVKPLRSAFFNAMVSGARKMAGGLRDEFA